MSDSLARLTAALADRYRIERELGAGGMATVYLAADLKHDRLVAIKVLKPELAAVLGAERFVQEIKTTAALSHPHILPLFDSGEAAGFLYYVMPYLEGETLRQKLDRETQLGIEEAVKITTEVADALDYAHRQGVIHRDIKPENILLYDGRPMVADFGIALAVSAAAGGRMTETGLSLGTPHYMSPEQATADKDITAKSDIYSLGAVLYEMLAGDPPHTGSSAQQIIAQIVTEDAQPVTKARKSVPANVAAAVAKALEKLPADRFSSAAAFRGALTDPTFSVLIAGRAGASQVTRSAWPALRTTVAWFASVAATAAVTWMLARGVSDASEEGARRLSIDLEPSPMAFVGQASLGLGRRNVTMSRDGSTIAYIGLEGGTGHLFVRRLDAFAAARLPTTEGAYAPFFSPSGRDIGYFVGNELRRIGVDGGDPIVLASVPNPWGGTWGDDNQIIFSGGEGADLRQVSADGGNVRVLVTAAAELIGFPHLLPDGRAALVSGRSRSYTVQFETRKITLIRDGATDPRYVAPGIVVFGTGSSLLASRFDPAKRVLLGRSVVVLGNVRTEISGVGQWAVSDHGDLVYAPGDDVTEGTLAWLALDGTVIDSVRVSGRRHGTFDISPDGTRLAIEVIGAEHSVWMYDLTTGAEQRLSLGTQATSPNWSADGTQVLFTGYPWPSRETYIRTVDAGAEEERLHAADAYWVSSWSPDGRFLAVSEGKGIAALELATGTVLPIHEAAGSWGTVFSPDGRAVAYTSDESGEYHVYVAPFPSTGVRKTASREGGAEEPIWAPSGDRLYYRNGQRLMSVSVRWTPELELGPPTVQFERDWVNVGGRSYDVSPDGTRFLVILPHASTTPRLNVVLNWLSEVRRRLDDGG